MIKLILFDCDGLIIRHTKYFSVRLAEDRGLKVADESAKEKEFFNGVFIDCEIGKADLKEELTKSLSLWQWQGTVDELMEYWFSGEARVEEELKDYILKLRAKGIKCFLSTNNEKYRTDYLWEKVGLKNIFSGMFPSCQVGCFKEEQKFWETIYGKLNITDKKEVLVLDDDQVNVDSAAAFGFNSEFYIGFEKFKKVMQEKYQIIA